MLFFTGRQRIGGVPGGVTGYRRKCFGVTVRLRATVFFRLPLLPRNGKCRNNRRVTPYGMGATSLPGTNRLAACNARGVLPCSNGKGRKGRGLVKIGFLFEKNKK